MAPTASTAGAPRRRLSARTRRNRSPAAQEFGVSGSGGSKRHAGHVLPTSASPAQLPPPKGGTSVPAPAEGRQQRDEDEEETTPSNGSTGGNDGENSFLAPHSVRMSYRIGRGEQGVLTFEPYKSSLLPLWRFRDPDAARRSAGALWGRFLGFAGEHHHHAGGEGPDGVCGGGEDIEEDGTGEEGGNGDGRPQKQLTKPDFVGMDMTRKFLQMGMTRAKRYANHAGGRKYEYETIKEKEKDEGDGNDKDTTRSRRGARVEKPRSENHKGKADKEEASRIFREYWMQCRDHEGYKRCKDEFLREQREWETSKGDSRRRQGDGASS